MNENALAYMESFFMALADKTRLRLLNLIRDQEICVCFFTEVLGESQPKISRHLAYLRNAGLVETRRDGKWMHYSIIWPEDNGQRLVLENTLDWLDRQEGLKADRERYTSICCSPEELVQIARTPMPFIEALQEDQRAEQPAAIHKHHNELEEFLL